MTDQINRRVTELEGEVAMVRVLASGADQEATATYSRLQAHNKTLHALRETQLEHGTRIDMLDRRVGRLECTVESGFNEMRAGFRTLKQGQAKITALLTGQLGECESSD